MKKTAAIDYHSLDEQLAAILAGESDALANSAIFVGFLFGEIATINWLGIYVLRGSELVLGPFQGRPACVRIPLGRGVCGTSAARQQTLRVADVHAFDGHIACVIASRSEIVVPLITEGRLLGVLDIDSPHTDRFSEADQQGVESLCATFIRVLERNAMREPDFI